MDVLFVVPYVPNLVRTRPYNLIRALTNRGNRVTVLTVWTGEADRQDLDALRKMVHAVEAVPMPAWRSLINCVPALLSGAPLQTAYSWDSRLVAPFNGRSPFDAIHVEHLRGVRYALHLKQHTRLPVVWDSVDCISHLFRQAAAQSRSTIGRWRSRFELGRTERYEGWLLDKFDRILVTSRPDQESMQALRPQTTAPIRVIPNGVDLDYFHPDPTLARKDNHLVVSGKMSYHANVSMVLHLAEQIMPLIWQQRPQAHLTIVGKDPVREIQALAAHSQITVTGTVPDLRPYLQQAAVALSPLTYGAGVQNKVLEAMACATPVVTASRAIAALEIQPGRDVLVADSPEDFARQVLHLLDHTDEQHRLGQAARAYVERHHNWHTIAGNLEEIYREASHQRHHAAAQAPVTSP